MINVYQYSLNSVENGEFWQRFPKNIDLWRQSEPFLLIQPILNNNRALLNFAIEQNLKMISVQLSATMLDGLASEYSQGFFDENDVPPPELWVDYLPEKACLIAVIPPVFEPMVSDVIENYNMSDCIEWFSF